MYIRNKRTICVNVVIVLYTVHLTKMHEGLSYSIYLMFIISQCNLKPEVISILDASFDCTHTGGYPWADHQNRFPLQVSLVNAKVTSVIQILFQ